jgi:predicted acylesterase/phospholipase RssA
MTGVCGITYAALMRPPALLTRRRILAVAAGGAASLPVAGCGPIARGPAVPVAQTAQASVLGLPNERFFVFTETESLEREMVDALDRKRRRLGLKDSADLPELDLLAISGGGENGAFGAGLLCAWSVQGTRPTFDWVTGVSTGALTAPFAFLGPAYDPQLRTVYTRLSPGEILRARFLTAALFSDAMADNTPLFRTISRFIDERLVADIARAYDQGRLLLIGTTDLDAQVPVIWNIGAIARSGHPRALEIIHKVLLASAAIPGAFPPTMIEVSVDGRAYEEMHVDGGAYAQTFLYPASLTVQRREQLAAHKRVIPVSAYVIRNGRLDPEWSITERRTLGIAGRAIATLISANGINDLIRIYNTTRNDDVDFHLAYIGRDFDKTLPRPFDPAYMQALFDYGYRKAIHGYDWATRPPLA